MRAELKRCIIIERRWNRNEVSRGSPDNGFKFGEEWWSGGLDRCILYCILFVFMLVLYCFCVATEFSVNKDLYNITNSTDDQPTSLRKFRADAFSGPRVSQAIGCTSRRPRDLVTARELESNVCIAGRFYTQNWLPGQRPLRDRKSNSRAFITIPANLVKIGPVDVQIKGLTESLDNEKKKHEHFMSPPSAALYEGGLIKRNSNVK